MNNKGFTLVEFLIWLFSIVVLFILVLGMTKNTLATSISQVVSDDKVFAAAENYMIKEKIEFNDSDYACVNERQLLITGYLKKNDNLNRTIKLTRNKLTKVIEKYEFVNECK